MDNEQIRFKILHYLYCKYFEPSDEAKSYQYVPFDIIKKESGLEKLDFNGFNANLNHLHESLLIDPAMNFPSSGIKSARIR